MGAGADRPVAVGTPPRHRGAARHEPFRAGAVGTPPRHGFRHAQGQGTDRPVLPRRRARYAHHCNGSPLAAFLYFCAALGAAVAIWLCKSPPPPPSYGSLQGYRGLAAAVVAALVVILFEKHPPGLVDQELTDGPNQTLAAPAPRIQHKLKQSCLALTGSILDAEQVAAAIRRSMADITRPFPAASPPQADSSDSDGSSSNGDEMMSYWYTSIHLLDTGGARLVVPGFIQQLHEMIRGLSEADAMELLRRAFSNFSKSDALCFRLSDAVESQCVIYPDPHGLTDRSTGTLVVTTKITAKLLHMIWSELDGQNWQKCQEVKKECFRQIVGQSVEKLLDAALSLSNAWSSGHPFQMLTIFDALVDALYNTRNLPFSRSELIPNEVHSVVAHIFCKMVVDFRGMLEATTDEMHSSKESTIHPATVLLVRFLEFWYRNGEMMQSVLGTGDCPIELTMVHYWVSKLGRDAETLFLPAAKMLQVKGQRQIFVMNNMFYVYEMKHHLGGFLSDSELLSLRSLIHQYIKSYLEEYWVPLVRYLDGGSLKTPRRSSLDRFIEGFLSNRDSQMAWKVRTKLKEMLREQIVKLIVPKYENFLKVLQEGNPSSRWPCCSKGMWRVRPEKPNYSAAWLERVAREFFER